MVIMGSRDLLTEVSEFLRVTLDQEKLSKHAQTCRQQLIAKLALKETSPTPEGYMDMHRGDLNKQNVEHRTSDFYEEFESFDTQKRNQTKQQIQDGFENNLYNNLSSTPEVNIYSNEYDSEDSKNLRNLNRRPTDDIYINPTSPLANTPVVSSRFSLPSKISISNSNSERNSIISSKNDFTDKSSDSSSVTSNPTRGEECAEVNSISASAIRYTAVKCGMLGHREKFLFIEHTKLYWVAVLNQTLYMFNSDKDSKPAVQMDITSYKARAVVSERTTKSDFKFELVCPGKKTHQFSADKELDVELWISALNSAAVDSSQRQLPQSEIVDRRRVIAEARYEVPVTIPRPISTKALSFQHEALVEGQRLLSQSTPSSRLGNQLLKEDRQLPQLPLPYEQPTYDQPHPTAKGFEQLEYENLQEEIYHCIPEHQLQETVDTISQFSELPQELEYDCPEPTVRPVKPQESSQEECNYKNGADNSNQEATYDNIEEAKVNTNMVIYNNVEEINDETTEEDNTYYNLQTSTNNKNFEADTEQESFYDVISEQRVKDSPSPVSFSDEKSNIYALNKELKLKFEGKLQPSVVNKSNLATIFNKRFSKPNLTVVRPPSLNKSCH